MILDELADIGRAGAAGGYTRLAWTAPELELREWFTASAEGLGLDVETDGNGNLWAWWNASAPGTALVLGSHLDSVPSGGAYDGPLGVASAFEAVRRAQRGGYVPARPVAIVAFSDEEGGRFGIACVGSRLLTGSLDAGAARGLRDAEGVSLSDAMTSAGASADHLGADPERLARIGEFVELHVEQGHLPVSNAATATRGLTAAGSALGVATEIWPHGRWRFDIAGTPNHAGTTPLDQRRDPVVAAAALITEVHRAAEDYGVLATVGKLLVEPGVVNAIAARARVWLDARGSDADLVRALVQRVERSSYQSAVEESWSAATLFDVDATARVARIAEAVTGAPVPWLPSGAGHDAGVLALAGVPTSMLFVRNPTGVSHAPDEAADDADVELGVLALQRILEDRGSDTTAAAARAPRAPQSPVAAPRAPQQPAGTPRP